MTYEEIKAAKEQLVEAVRKLGPVTALEVIGDEVTWHHPRPTAQRDRLGAEIYTASAACAQLIDRFNEGGRS